MKDSVILLYYKYIRLPRPKDYVMQQRAVCLELGLKGRILIAQEGLNGTVEGTAAATEKYIEWMNQHDKFSGINFKKSQGTGNAFPKLVVRARKEVVTTNLGQEDIDPNQVTGKYLSAEDLDKWFAEGRNFKIVDMRNDYEQEVGHFEGSILPGMENFRDLKTAVKKLEPLKDETIVAVCTGGIRCEKASGYLVTQGFKDVYQLKDGIVTYMEKFPNKKFMGKLYVFDDRITMGFETESPERKIIGRCKICSAPSENYINCADDECHKHIICCANCLEANGQGFCKPECRERVLARI